MVLVVILAELAVWHKSVAPSQACFFFRNQRGLFSDEEGSNELYANNTALCTMGGVKATSGFKLNTRAAAVDKESLRIKTDAISYTVCIRYCARMLAITYNAAPYGEWLQPDKIIILIRSGAVLLAEVFIFNERGSDLDDGRRGSNDIQQ